MNVLIEMTSLAIGRPTADADAETVAVWYEAKARLHEHLARQDGTDSARENALALRAHERALRARGMSELAVA
ncbi:hypothetical protein [Antrihabitans sp. YC2-6]|uniref:hypothetical protein n=1 Tax=Antrihabitans sp. YC2-6 TaxID=2799498 RepID=UPI0018F3527C|nr:hypothetical protein [Antrihabitans sp. YC2-6]MBJ8346424.1 hypothetical protein [Antrihabitans sp. YC2-6]